MQVTSIGDQSVDYSNAAPMDLLPIYSKDADKDLENYKGDDDKLKQSLKLKNAIEEFRKKGGEIVRMDGNTTPFQLKPGDLVFPSCSGGNNRSQTLWNILRVYDKAIDLQFPHSTRDGFDPYLGFDPKLAKVKWKKMAHKQEKGEFFEWAKVNKSIKFGFDNATFQQYLKKYEEGQKEPTTAEQRSEMTKYYNNKYFKPENSAGKRRIYITFDRNAHAHVVRLNQTNENLKDVVILYYPIKDVIRSPLPEWNAGKRSVKAYTELAKMLSKYLDFSKLAKIEDKKSQDATNSKA